MDLSLCTLPPSLMMAGGGGGEAESRMAWLRTSLVTLTPPPPSPAACSAAVFASAGSGSGTGSSCISGMGAGVASAVGGSVVMAQSGLMTANPCLFSAPSEARAGKSVWVWSLGQQQLRRV